MRTIKRIEVCKETLPARKRVAAYARVSSGKDAMLQSLAAQVSYYSDTIQKRPEWLYAGVYADEGVTGTKDSRSEFQRLLADCRQGKMDLVLTKSISRFARNTVMLLEAIRELKVLGVDVYFEKENIHSISGDGELLLSILASFAQAESQSVSENCKWRIRKRFAKGELVNLQFMFGYRIEDGEIGIEPDQAAIVRMIFEDYTAGLGCPTIAKKLRGMGVKRPRGGVWYPERVAEILKNEKYAGNALLQKKYVEDHLTKKLVVNKGGRTQYFAEGTHSAIVDEGTFQKAQAIMADNRKKNVREKGLTQYPFTSKIVCGKCGKNYRRKMAQGRAAWNCSTYLKLGRDSCHTKQIPEAILVSLAAEAIGLKEFDEAVFTEQVKEIQIPDSDLLVFVFHDGRTIQRKWQNQSRRESWSEQARQEARERRYQHLERRSISS